MNQKLGRRKREGRKKQGEAFQWLVAEVVKAFQPAAKVEVGEWVTGPDGRRELDVTMRGRMGDREVFILIECKDYTYSTRPTPVGIGDIDAFESKRRDLSADFAFVASNSGFTLPAMRKAGRTAIGAIAVLKEGDPRGKARIVHNLYLRDFTPEKPFQIYYLDDEGKVAAQDVAYGQTLIEGESIEEWLMLQAVLFQVIRPWESREVRADFKFKEPITVTIAGKPVRLSSIAISFKWITEWLQQTVEIDAGTGLVDYLQGRLFMAPGANRITFRDIDFDKGEKCDPPSKEVYQLQARFKGEVGFRFCRARNVGNIRIPGDSAISRGVIPEDLSAMLKPFSGEETLTPGFSASGTSP